MSSSFFEPLLDYLGEPGAHLKSTEASRIIEDLAKSATAWRGDRIPSEGSSARMAGELAEPIELIEAMELCSGALDPSLLDDLLIHTISQ